MINFAKRHFIMIIVILVALFLYSFNLHQTFFMYSDTARELLRTLEIWQKKEITMIGPPLNTINNKPIQVYFGSMGYYLAIVGLIFSNFDPIGSVYPNIVLTLVSIPFFFLLSKKLLGKNLATISTILYAIAPTTLAFVRSSWYPNPIIPLSVFVWYFILYKSSIRSYIFAGLISGVIFNLHYLNIIPIGVYILSLLFSSKGKKLVIPFLGGFAVTLSPLIAFEVKNNFFLTKALLTNSGGFSTFSSRILNPLFSFDVFFYIFGLGAKDFYLPNLFSLSTNLRIVIDTIIGAIFLIFLARKQKIFDLKLKLVLLIGLLVGWYFQTTDLIHIRYLFSIYPLLIIFAVSFISSFSKYLLIILFFPILILDWKIINYVLDPATEYYPLSTIEAVSQAIVLDNPTGKYNITENILGDARSQSFRYFLMRDAKVKPLGVEEYDRVDTLYVATTSLNKTYQDNRWEFTASGPKKIAWEKDFGDLKLYKFIK